MSSLLDRRVVLVTGKGGVGRSTVTAAMALLARRAGKRVLVTELGDGGTDYSALARMFGQDRLPETSAPLTDGIDGSLLLPGTGLELFLTALLRFGPLARAAAHSDALRRLLNAAPSFREMGIFFHLLTYLREKRPDGTPAHDLVLVDMPATGHTLALTALPAVLLRLVSRGPIPDALREGQSYLNNPETGAAYVVTLPEALPISEALELAEGLKANQMPIGGIVLNRIPADPFTSGEKAALGPLIESNAWYGADGFRRILESQRCSKRLVQASEVPVLEVNESDRTGPHLLEYVADSLVAGVPA